MNRRALVSLLGGAAAWPLAARGQPPETLRRVGVLFPGAADDQGGQARLAAFLQALQPLGWTDGRNVRLEYRWGGGDSERTRKHAVELAALAPDVILATGTSTLAWLLQATRTVPIVFAQVTDPVGGGFVRSLARPGGNATGFSGLEYGMSGKWLELLKQVAPATTRAAIIRNPSIASGSGQFGALQAVAPLLGVEVTPIDVRDVDETERSVAEFARGSTGGLILTTSAAAIQHRERIIALAARYRLPTVYWDRQFAAGGGLMSYGMNVIESYRQAAGYVDRILRGEKPADLPVQAPTRYELVINLRTAKALDLGVPPMLLARADEVIE
jgi:putative tryptophan/tyrosine transport system substrate-binding protein